MWTCTHISTYVTCSVRVTSKAARLVIANPVHGAQIAVCGLHPLLLSLWNLNRRHQLPTTNSPFLTPMLPLASADTLPSWWVDRFEGMRPFSQCSNFHIWSSRDAWQRGYCASVPVGLLRLPDCLWWRPSILGQGLMNSCAVQYQKLQSLYLEVARVWKLKSQLISSSGPWITV